MTVQDQLIRWYAKNARRLPWRSVETTAWQVLVSEIMLQQTQAQRVTLAYTDWIAKWPDAKSLADATPAQVLRQWGNLGYPSRALRLRECAMEICDRFGGVVPDDYDTLKSLPGIGDYTASAIVAFAFKKRAVVLDTNVRRVIDRIWNGKARPNQTISVVERAFAENLTPRSDAKAARWSIAVMEFGALVCIARQPACHICPVRQECRWYQLGKPPAEVKTVKQKFAGTDRQVRGKIMALLRSTDRSITASALEDVWADSRQLQRALQALLDDGLVEKTRSGRYRLPMR